MIAALYVETDGCYFGLPDVDPWDIARDARQYAGPHPVVAHPPCQRWGRFWHGSGGYKWAEQTYRRDWWAWTVALSIAAILMVSGIGALSIAWWLA